MLQLINSFKINPVTPYTEDYNEMLTVARNEQNNNARPEIKEPLTDISKYEVILLGTSLWYSHIPNIVITQLEKLNFQGKTIYPFNTHGGSGVGSTVNDIKQYANGANVKEGFPLRGDYVKNNKDNAMNDINQWIEKNFSFEEEEKEEKEEEEEDVYTPKSNSVFINIKYILMIGLFSLIY